MEALIPELKEAIKQKYKSIRKVNHQESMRQVQQLTEQIEKSIQMLDEKLDQTLEQHEKSYLVAYRYQMLKVQKELLNLKKRSNEDKFIEAQEEARKEQEEELFQLKQEVWDLLHQTKRLEEEILEKKTRVRTLESEREFWVA